jgi:LacI family transcriptional regulator
MRKPKVKMLDVARHAGLSRATVSLAFKDSPLLRVETRKQVIDAAKALGYIYNRSAANLRRTRSDMVGMIINDLTNPFFAELAVGCERVLRNTGHVVVLANTGEQVDRQTAVIERMREQGVAGIIICPARGTPADAFGDLVDAGIPIVQAMRVSDTVNASSVLPDNRAGAREAVIHLAGKGHRRIAFAGGFDDTSVLTDRLGGYHDGMREAGLAVAPEWVVEGAPTRAFGATLAERFSTLTEPPTALLAFNDAVALGFCHGLRRRGMEPGRDIAVIGFDDVKEAAYAVPALSTIAVDAEGLGEKAAAMLIEKIDNSSMDPQRYVGPARLVIRET